MTSPGKGSGLEGATTAAGAGDTTPVVDPLESPSPLDPAIRQRYGQIEALAAGTRDARYLARRPDTGSLVELQVLSGELASDDALVRALRDQAARLAGISGNPLPIATVFECDRTTGGKLVLAMEHPQGPTLRNTIHREGKVVVERALQLALQVAEALEVAHNLGLVHGGLRPENVVLVGPEPTVVLTHFGLDRLLVSRSTGRHEEETVGANPAAVYQAPEQASGETTERSDIYALGVLLYEMLTGTPPPTEIESCRRLGSKPWRTRRAEISPSLERLITRALEVAPGRRPPYMSVVCNDLADEINLHRQHTAARRRVAAGPGAGKLRALFVACAVLAVTGVLAIWVAYPRLTFVASKSSRPAPIATTPPAPAPSSTASGPGGAHGVENASGPGTPAASPATRGTLGPLLAPTGQSANPSEGASGARLGEKPETTSRPRRSQTPPRPESPKNAARAGDQAEPAQPQSRTVDVTEPQRHRPTSAPRPHVTPETREAGEDPSAIIDWLLSEGGRSRR
jgi:hypothetical protein